MRSLVQSSVLVLLILVIPTGRTRVEGAPGANCSSRCGGVSVPYPFGIMDDGDDCYLRPAFGLNCNHSYEPPRLLLGNIEVSDIGLLSSHLRILLNMSSSCYNGTNITSDITWSVVLSNSTYAISHTENTFTGIGCDTLAYIGIGHNNTGGCISACNDVKSVVDGKCSGIGCCEATVHEGLSMYRTSFSSFSWHKGIKDFNPCSYSFLAEKGNYTFHVTDLEYMDRSRAFPVVLDWFVGNQSCQEAKENETGYACVSSNSECFNALNGPGYICNCSQGYAGNPYLPDGCQDIDECTNLDRVPYPCHGICTNTPGSYNCSCPEGFSSEDPKTQKCAPDPTKQGISLAFKLVIGIGSGLFFSFLASSFCYFQFQTRKMAMLRKKFFEQNGGSLLERSISSRHPSAFKIFTMTELENATNNFDMDQVLGRGGFGVVYKGITSDGCVIAVKKSMMIDDKRSKEFANEMFILSQINHKSIVKLLGCCLEVEIPMLVYEYVPNGTLFNHIHNKKHSMAFEFRLKIATEAAEALRYLHIDASPPILHGDVKSSNILLDENYNAKISDFGTSTLAPKDKSQFTTLVQGTYGYLDPEYLQTSQLTDKSDVYSFGVVLVELLTRKKPFCFDGTEKDRSLAINFISCMTENKLIDILDPEIIEDGLTNEVMQVATISMRCLNVKGDERPTMKEIVLELEELRGTELHPWMAHGPETETLLGESSIYSHDISVDKQTVFDIEGGR